MGLLDSNYSAVNGKKPRNSGRLFAGEELNGRGLLDAATNIPVVGDALSGGMAIYDAAKGDYGSAAMNALGVLPFVSGSMVAKGSKVADAVNGKKLTEFEQRHLTAQKNAALPIEQGGLGLPFDNTAMQRADALGFDTPAYHGSGRDFTEFKNSMLGAKTGAKSAQKAHFFASNPEVSNTYVNTSHVYNDSPPVYEKLFNNPEAFDAFTKAETKDAKWAVLQNNGMNYSSGQVMPVLLNKGKTRVKDYGGAGYRDATYNDELIAARKAKKDSVELKNTYDRGPHEGSNAITDIYAVFDPSNVRSRFAAFDPMRRHESDLLGYADPRLLAGIAGGGLLGLGGYSLMGDK